MEPLICKCCGAPINRERMVCEYCGAQYKRDDIGMPLYVERVTSPVIRLKAQCKIPMESMKYGSPEDLSKFAMNRLVEQLAEGLADAMKVETYNDYCNSVQIITAEVRCLKSDYRF